LHSLHQRPHFHKLLEQEQAGDVCAEGGNAKEGLSKHS